MSIRTLKIIIEGQDRLIADLKQAICDANENLKIGEGVTLLYHSYWWLPQYAKSYEIIKEVLERGNTTKV